MEMIRDLKTIIHHSIPEADYVEEEYPVYWKEEDLKRSEVKVDSHKHSLVLNSDHHGNQEEIICDGCIVPIDQASSPYYECEQHCEFFLHTTCVVLPEHFGVDYKWDHHRSLYNSPKFKLYFPENSWEVVKCKACDLFFNGYGYKCTDSSCNFYLDIKCFFITGAISHIGHKNLLLATKHGSEKKCIGCGHSIKAPYIRSDDIKDYLGYECATLPATVKHKWDKHPLVLSFPPFFRDIDQDEDFFCEVCEEEIHPQHWTYRCVECDHCFHPDCIPTLGESRNIKFGVIVSAKIHPHRLTFVPQAILTSRCHNCRKSLYWSRAFECAPCGFYLCHDCIVKEEPVMESLPRSSTTFDE